MIKAVPKTEILVIRELKLESQVLMIYSGIVTKVPSKSNYIREEGQRSELK